MELNYDIYEISFEEVLKLSKVILEQIKSKNLKIDTLIPVLRGGMPLALLLASNLGEISTSCIHVRSSVTNKPNSSFDQTKLLGITNVDQIKDKNVLVVEDIIDSGYSMDATLEILKKYEPQNIYIATLYNFNKDRYKNVISGSNREACWIIFPWEKEI